MHHRAWLLASGAIVAGLLAGSAQAQTRSATQAAAANTIEELVVTAEKRAQSLQDVPVAISAFTSEKRDLIGINTVQDLTNFTPGLNYSTATDRISLRGVGRLTNAHPIDTAVATYSDGIYTTSTVEAGKTPIFVDRVEILRGPQGTLYGRNAIGGAINVISKRPTEDFYAEVRGTIANYNATLVEAAISGPLAPGLQVRLAGNWNKQTEGYYENIVPGMPSEGNVVDTWYVEGQVQAQMFDDKLEGWAKMSVAGWNNGGGGPGARAGYSPTPFAFSEFGASSISPGWACAPAGTAGPSVINVVNASPAGCTNPATSDPHKFANRIAQSVSLDDTYTVASEWVYHFDGVDLKYIVGGNHYEYTLFQDNGTGSIVSFQIPVAAFRPGVAVAAQPCPATNLVAPGACQPLTVFPKLTSTYQEKYYNWSHELNLASTSDGPLQWLGGLYYYKEGYDQPVFTTLHDQPQILNAPIAARPDLTGSVLPASYQRRLYDDRPTFEMVSYAAYGQIDWQFTKTLKTTIGLRYSHDEKTGVESVRAVCFATTPCGIAPELFGSLAPVVDVTGSVAYTGGPAGTPLANRITPQGVVPREGSFGGVTFDAFGYATRYYSAEWEAVTGTAGLQWDPNPDTMAYARYSRGYKAGGFNSGITTTLGEFPYTAPEYIDDIEIGLKKTFGGRFQANLALFHYNYEDLQAPLTVANNSGTVAPSQTRFLNVPKSISQGIELETTWAPIDNLTILFNYSYNDAHVEQLTDIYDPDDPLAIAPGATPYENLITCSQTDPNLPANLQRPCDVNTGFRQRPQNLKGNSLPQAAKNKVALNATYTWRFNAGSLTPSISYIWRDKEYSSLFERDTNASKAWDQVDIRASWTDTDRRYTIIGYVKNVFDELGYAGGAGGSRRSGTFPLGAPGVTPGLASTTPGRTNGTAGLGYTYALTPPRLYGVEFQYRF